MLKFKINSAEITQFIAVRDDFFSGILSSKIIYVHEDNSQADSDQ